MKTKIISAYTTGFLITGLNFFDGCSLNFQKKIKRFLEIKSYLKFQLIGILLILITINVVFANEGNVIDPSKKFTKYFLSKNEYHLAIDTSTVYWLGMDSNWNNIANWNTGAVPVSYKNVFIGSGFEIYPVINYDVAIKNLTIDDAGFLMVSLYGKLSISGRIKSKFGIDARVGTIELNGNIFQEISADNFSGRYVSHLIISNSYLLNPGTTANVSINTSGGKLQIIRSLSFGNVNQSHLETNNNLLLLTSDTTTAYIADLTNNDVNYGNTINGNVIYERYISAKRAWRLLSAPVTEGSNVKISESWQEGAARVTNPAIINAENNPNPGYGTHITYGNPAINGYDQGINGNPSIKFLTNTGWDGVPVATNNGAAGNSGYVTDQSGYFLFVRGDRGTPLSLGNAAPVSPTILRMKGEINQGLLHVPLTTKFTVSPSVFMVVGNPYPSSINYHKVMQNANNVAAGFSDAFYFWDPNITGNNGVGGWVAMAYNSSTGLYDQTVRTGGSSSINNLGDIQSGSAIVIDYSGAATSIEIKEYDKVKESDISQFRPVMQVRAVLYAKNSDNSLSVNDGALQIYDTSFNNEVDNMDMKKLDNFTENISILNNGNKLSIEKRIPIRQRDTIQIYLSQLKLKDYKLVIAWDKILAPEGTIAFMEDAFTKTKTPLKLKDSSRFYFNVSSEEASFNPERFRVIFQPSATFISLNAAVSGENNNLEFKLENEFNIKKYEIEKSANGLHYFVAFTLLSKGNNGFPVNYKWTDENCLAGSWYYRVKSIYNNADVIYSNSVKVIKLNDKPELHVFPNPVSGDNFSLQMNGLPKGWYKIKLFNAAGKLLLVNNINVSNRNSIHNIKADKKLLNGIYLLQLTGFDEILRAVKLVVLNQ